MSLSLRERIFLPNPPPPFGRGRTKVGEGLSFLLPLPLGGGGLRWGRASPQIRRIKELSSLSFSSLSFLVAPVGSWVTSRNRNYSPPTASSLCQGKLQQAKWTEVK